MKAWVINDDEGYGAVVFADDELSAMDAGADQLDGYIEECRRESQFDQYANTGVPVEVLIKEHGWWWGCFHCDRMVHRDADCFDTAVFVNGVVYCCQACRDERQAEIDKVNAEFVAFQVAILSTHTRFEITGFEGGYPWRSPTAYFTFPGEKYGGGKIRIDLFQKQLAYSVAQGDLDAFRAWENGLR